MGAEIKSGHKSLWRSNAAVLKNSLRVEAAHCDIRLPRAQAVDLFRRHASLVEVETTSYCNRTCSFCPNSFVDRRSKKHAMPDAVWERILDDLRGLDYSSSFFWSRYSEPTSEDRLVERIREVRRAAPKARIGINSNGDYLNADYLHRLIDAGLNRLWIDIYMPDDEPYERSIVEAHHARFLKRIEKTAAVIGMNPEFVSKAEIPGVDMWITVRNLASLKQVDLSDRGGLIQIARRTSRVSPCYAPFKHLVIDWDGSVVICCQVRSDYAPQKGIVVAKIGDDGVGLVEAYVALGRWRDSLKSFGPKPEPCGSCNVFEYHPTRLAKLIGQMLADERLPGAPLIKTVASRMIGRTIMQ